MADKDLWLFSGIPPDYPDIIWTEGYSIENDLYAGASLEDLLNADEVDEHGQVLDSIMSSGLRLRLKSIWLDRDAQVDRHCNENCPAWSRLQWIKAFRNSSRISSA